MSDTHSNAGGAVAKRERSQRTKLTLKDLGEPAIVKAMTAEQLKACNGKALLGRLFGIARGFAKRESPKDGEVFEGLTGYFRVVPANPNALGAANDAEEIESGMLFIPDAFHNIIAEKLRPAQVTDPNATVEFVFEVSSIPAKNPAGYSWDFVPLTGSGVNPLDRLVGVVAKLPPPNAKPALAAPAKK